MDWSKFNVALRLLSDSKPYVSKICDELNVTDHSSVLMKFNEP